MDTETISVLVAAFAATAAASVALIQLYVGHRQSDAALISARAAMMNAKNAGRHQVAIFRQAWIDKVIDTFCEYHSLIMTTPGVIPLPEETLKKLTALRTRLDLLLNPDEPQNVELLGILDLIAQTENVPERFSQDAEGIGLARKILKREWVRIKTELTEAPTPPNAAD